MCVRTNVSSLSLAVLVAALGAGCSEPRYVYAPVRTTSAEIDGASSAVRVVPPGEVRVTTVGIVSLTQGGGGGGTRISSRALHLQFVVVNRTDRDWAFEGDAQRVESARQTFHATNADLGPPPRVVFPAQSTRATELYFPLPPAFELGAFDLVWTLHDGEPHTYRTSFERFLSVAPPE
jgi:hypothetical protein